jgi:uracil-DNA glycosylase
MEIGGDWYDLLKEEMGKEYFRKLQAFIEQEYATHTIYPKRQDLYNALRWTSYSNTRVLVAGQDPYPGPDQAHGLAFSVNTGVPIPRSLMNIYKELKEDADCYIPNHGYLEKWAEQGVLLLNAVLTVRAGKPDSHKGKGWEFYTDRIISLVNEKEEPVVFILWGANAQKKKALITNERHMVIESPHPSPLSARRGFFGSKPFTSTNEFLKEKGRKPIDWQIDNI